MVEDVGMMKIDASWYALPDVEDLECDDGTYLLGNLGKRFNEVFNSKLTLFT